MPAQPAPTLPGDYAPWFHAKALEGSDRYAFHSVGGRHVLMLFFGTASQPGAKAALDVVQKYRKLFDDEHAIFFGVTVDPTDVAQKRIAQSLPGIRHFLDYDRAVSRLYGAAHQDQRYEPFWMLMDRELRIVGKYPLAQGEEAIAELKRRTAVIPDSWAPVLTVPGVFDEALCKHLISLYEADGGTASGFMRDVNGKTTHILDDGFKQRRDTTIEDPKLIQALSQRVARRVAPAIERAFAFKATRIERHIVACYEAGKGHFRPHRDNTTFGTAHRRFAVTINLNAEDYEGGNLRFPEFGNRTYRAPTGGAVVFSCSLLHEATPVTKGKRYAFLPFLYDEEAKAVREANLDKLAAQEMHKRAHEAG
ncbi:2OG-Fe(II) oxygenase [Qipengyuania sp. 1NDH17]|uniref:2OG-Fe(II) oxygenase n=1 Tax=Qipengyuania polymorpha TaxID=2867234 RepID=A0ABS7ITG3_9SPHN|nr:2OG-Fe(II) oxygenase [Qipengyuania polymorpha]MBX7456632.1 2OG-Fe(II) oxygenase [Qipengyuania polymorpha]